MTENSFKYLSICSGIESATVAWEPLGWEAIAFSEIDPFCSAVLEHHYPNIINLGDLSFSPFILQFKRGLSFLTVLYVVTKQSCEDLNK